jgi:homoserine dehydrogenase
MKVIKTAMLGMGSVNQNLLQILVDKQDQLANEYGVVFQIVAATDSSGIAVNKSGFDMMALVKHKQRGGHLSELGDDSYQGGGRDKVQQVLQDLDLDLLFEATPCCVGDPTTVITNNVDDGEALAMVRSALTRGVSVVLANKGPLVRAIAELQALSQASTTGGHLAYSATVCGGLPILNIGRRDMIAGKITKLQGVFNATSNFVLDAMARGDSFQDALQEAKHVGAAEADPSLDTDGWDTAFKLLIIANTILVGSTTTTPITLADISVEGIQNVTPTMIQTEAARGNAIKLLATADEHGHFSVRPVPQPTNSFLGSITGWEMGVEIHSDIYGITYHKLYEKEPIPTAASMMRDAVNMFSTSSR